MRSRRRLFRQVASRSHPEPADPETGLQSYVEVGVMRSGERGERVAGASVGKAVQEGKWEHGLFSGHGNKGFLPKTR